MRILIADDDPVSLRILEHAVEQSGHDIALAHDGSEAWDRLQREPFDVLISDWVMPEMDGLELCKRVRERKDAPFCYVMLVTQRDATQDVVRGIMAGANDFMSKPCDRSVLHARLHSAERTVELERALARRIVELEDALEEVATLRRLLPICVYCKSIRNDQQAWADIEEYFREHAQTDFTHSVCPTCYEGRIQPMLDDMKRDLGAH